jgi:hypothetical protein
MAPKRSLAVAAAIFVALVASGSAFALANTVSGAKHPDRVGTFTPVDQRLIPAVTTTTTTHRSSARAPGQTTGETAATSRAPTQRATAHTSMPGPTERTNVNVGTPTSLHAKPLAAPQRTSRSTTTTIRHRDDTDRGAREHRGAPADDTNHQGDD